jgi:hypothetical protein
MLSNLQKATGLMSDRIRILDSTAFNYHDAILFVFPPGLEIEPRASCMLSAHSTTPFMLEFLIYFSYDPGTPSGFLSSSRQM